MRLEIDKFRCYTTPRTFEFKPGATCIRGKSGIGKSTIFTALLWVLYGREKKVQPLDNENAKTCVILTLGDLVIKRSKRPELLSITYNGQTYDGDPAQSIIDQFFLPYDLFRCVSMVNRSERNLFLSSSQKERAKILELLGSNQERLEEKYNRLDEMMKEQNKEMVRIQDEIKVTQGIIASFPHNLDIDTNINYEQRLIKLEKELVDCERGWNEFKEAVVRQKHITEELKRFDSLISVIPTDIDDRLVRLREEKERIPICKIIEEYERMKREVKYIDEKIDVKVPNIDVTVEELEATYKSEIEWHYYLTECRKHNVTDLREELDRLYPIVSRIKEYRDRDEKKELEGKIDLKLPPTDKAEDIYADVKSKSTVNALICPECKTKVHHHNGVLIKAEKDSIDPSIVSQATKLLERCRERDALLKRFNELSFGDLDNIDLRVVEEMQRRYNLIASIKTPSQPGPEKSHLELTIIRANRNLIQRRQEYQEKIQELESKINLSLQDWTKPRSLDIILAEENQLQRYREQLHAFNQTRESLKDQLLSIVIEEPMKSAKDVLIEIETVKVCIKLLQYANKLAVLLTREMELQKPLNDLRMLKDEMQKAEFESFTEFIDTINGWLISICAQMFEEDILVQIALTKSLKSTKEIKNNINLSVRMKGYDVDPSTPSDGQKDRIALALTAALYKATGSKIMLIDEILGSLQNDLRDSIFKKIGEWCHDGFILNIVHDESEELFDKIESL